MKQQYSLNTESLNPTDKYLFNQSRLELWAQKREYIRAWLSTVLIIRGEFDKSKNEIQNDQDNQHYH